MNRTSSLSLAFIFSISSACTSMPASSRTPAAAASAYTDTVKSNDYKIRGTQEKEIMRNLSTSMVLIEAYKPESEDFGPGVERFAQRTDGNRKFSYEIALTVDMLVATLGLGSFALGIDESGHASGLGSSLWLTGLGVMGGMSSVAKSLNTAKSTDAGVSGKVLLKRDELEKSAEASARQVMTIARGTKDQAAALKFALIKLMMAAKVQSQLNEIDPILTAEREGLIDAKISRAMITMRRALQKQINQSQHPTAQEKYHVLAVYTEAMEDFINQAQANGKVTAEESAKINAQITQNLQLLEQIRQTI